MSKRDLTKQRTGDSKKLPLIRRKYSIKASWLRPTREALAVFREGAKGRIRG